MNMTNPALIESIAAHAAARTAHHESGHAVAAVAMGGTLIEISMGFADWTTDDDSNDIQPYARYQLHWDKRDFVTFAGPCAEALFESETDSETEGIGQELEYAFWDNNADGDTLKLDSRLGGFSLYDYDQWIDQVTELWPVIKQVAALLLDGTEVTHEIVGGLLT